LLRKEGPGHPQVSYGLDSSQVLEQIMGASPRSEEIDKQLKKLFTSIEENNLPSAKALLDVIRKRVPLIPELDGAEALIRRKEVIGR